MGAQAAPPSTEQKVLDAIGKSAALASDIAGSFGHPTVASAVNEYSSLAPVFAGFVDIFIGLFHHAKKTAS